MVGFYLSARLSLVVDRPLRLFVEGRNDSGGVHPGAVLPEVGPAGGGPETLCQGGQGGPGSARPSGPALPERPPARVALACAAAFTGTFLTWPLSL